MLSATPCRELEMNARVVDIVLQASTSPSTSETASKVAKSEICSIDVVIATSNNTSSCRSLLEVYEHTSWSCTPAFCQTVKVVKRAY